MFETTSFMNGLFGAADSAVNRVGIDSYEEAIIIILRFLAVANESYLMKIENQYPQSFRRGIPEATQNAERLIEAAANVAQSAGRNRVAVDDLANAYARRYCDYWPFCR